MKVKDTIRELSAKAPLLLWANIFVDRLAGWNEARWPATSERLTGETERDGKELRFVVISSSF